jgi:hypothetical protein
MRATTVGAARIKAGEDASYHAANSAASNISSSAPFVTMAIVALDQGQLPVATYFATRAATIKASPQIELAQARALAAAGDPAALGALDRAAKSTGDTGALALGIHQLALGRYADAATTLATITTTSYEVLVARGVVLRAQGKLADAETRYNAAIIVDAKRPEAHFDLGVLYKDYTAVRATVPATAKAALIKAAAEFRLANTKQAKDLADDCDRAAASL